MDKYTNLITRVLFVAAFVFAGLATLERLLNVVGGTVGLRRIYDPGRVLEFCAVMLLFVIALVLRDIKHHLATKRSGVVTA